MRRQLQATQQQSAAREAVLQRRLDEAPDSIKLSDERIARRNRQIERLCQSRDEAEAARNSCAQSLDQLSALSQAEANALAEELGQFSNG